MDHEEIYLLMMDALDGELPEDGWNSLESHLRACPACEQEWYALQAIETLLRTTPALAPPADMVQRTLMRLPNPAYRTWVIGAVYSLLLLSGILPVVGAVVLLGTFGTTVFNWSVVSAFLTPIWDTITVLPIMLSALLNALGAFIAQQPAIVGVLLVMVGVIMVWGGVYSQLIASSPRLAMSQARA